ncbi:C1QL [Mytilus coruscus]|uniref:C1QL n=1 Tax=Mytilus coruscus TaxID=42192 RepID=A0A6J8B4B1_MYTCO|nr:C1QL [Mytilus coruscus]
MKLFLNFMFISCLQTVLANNKAERLLLNDPALIMERLTQLENTVQQQAATIQTQAQEIHQLQTAVNSTGDMTPAFFAILTSNIAIGNAEILKFNQVKTNIGGGYDVVTGVFIAPKSGTYHFTSVVYTNGKGDAVVQLNKNKDLLVKGYSVGTTHAESHTMNAIVALQRDDHIYVQHRGVSSDAVLGESHSSYSGFLISE